MVQPKIFGIFEDFNSDLPKLRGSSLHNKTGYFIRDLENLHLY